jgi:putative acetyltransferase
LILRRERAGDEAAIAAVHAAAFARPETPGEEPPEAPLVASLRGCDGWIPELSIVALDGDAIVGHVVCTRATIDGSIAVLGLGPLGVLPDHQNAGVGTALVHAVVAAADARNEPIVVLLGSPAYYRRFGFETASAHGIVAPSRSYGDAFQVRKLTAATGTERGRFAYAQPFEMVP